MKFFLPFLLLHLTFSLFAQVSNNDPFLTKDSKASGLDKVPPPKVRFFGTGNLLKSVTDGNDDSPATGSIGLSVNPKDYYNLIIGFTINKLKSTQINNPNDFGGNLLIPSLEGKSFSLSFTRKIAKAKKNLDHLGAHLDIVTAPTKWSINNNEYNAAPTALRIGAKYNIPIDSEEIWAEIFLGYSMRTLLGDLNNVEKNFLYQNLGTETTTFHGLELSASIQLNSVNFFINVPLFFGEQINGLTGGQVNIGTNIAGDIFKIKRD